MLQRQDEQREAQAQQVASQAAYANTLARRGQLLVLDRQADMQRQQVKALQAQADQLKQEIADRMLRSPVNGVVDRTLGDVGDYIQAGQWVMMVHDPKNVWVGTNVKETALGEVAVGQPVTVGVDAYPGRLFAGEVSEVAQQAEFTPKEVHMKDEREKLVFGVKLRIQNPEGLLKPGMPADARIQVEPDAPR